MDILGDKQNVTSRPYRDDDDFWLVRKFLIETYPITPTGFNWEIRRWDGFRFYNSTPDPDPGWSKTIRLWETGDGNLAGVVHPEGTGDAHLEMHPDFRHIEQAMIEWAWENLATADSNNRRLRVFVNEYDSLRSHLLESLGFQKTTKGEVHRRLRFGNKEIPPAVMPSGYALHVVNPDHDSDCQHLADLLNEAFNRDFHTAAEFRVFAAHAPCLRRNIDLAAIAEDGSFAAYVGVPYVEENRYGVFEPVCTHPDHLRRGLARSLMLEGLRRLKSLNAADVYVGTGDQVAANRLYNNIGFTEAYRKCMWEKAV